MRLAAANQSALFHCSLALLQNLFMTSTPDCWSPPKLTLPKISAKLFSIENRTRKGWSLPGGTNYAFDLRKGKTSVVVAAHAYCSQHSCKILGKSSTEKVTTRCLHFTKSLVHYKQKMSVIKLLQFKCLSQQDWTR